MCGIAGFVELKGNYDLNRVARHMANAIAHRGPDAEGVWVDRNYNVALAHRRLSIVDLTSAGSQPMVSACGRYVIAFNGEIYNHLELRRFMESAGRTINWRGHSDTETLLECIGFIGIDETLRLSYGMFAVALWDNAEKVIYLARDRFGEKPLYYGWQSAKGNRTFVFASELKSLRVHPSFEGHICRKALASYTRFMGVEGTQCIYEGLNKLSPGGIVKYELSDSTQKASFYWKMSDVVNRARALDIKMSDSDALAKFDAVLNEAVKSQMHSDVPLGAFLSGGVDSSAIVALMKRNSDQPIKTFSIGFDDKRYDEAGYAKEVAKYLGTEHYEKYVTSADALGVIPKLPLIYDEPFADSSAIPTYLVSELAKQHVTVCLSGDAGDELFGGYNRYAIATASWSKLKRLPRFFREGVANTLLSVEPSTWDKLGGLFGATKRWAAFGDKIQKGAEVLSSDSVESLYLGLTSTWKNPEALICRLDSAESGYFDSLNYLGPATDVEKMMYLDAIGYLNHDILVKVDRASMAVSLESRIPFLDPRVAEFAWSLPTSQKLRADGGKITTKWLLRELLYQYVPRALIERPKMGFGVPIDSWLRQDLKSWALELIDPIRLKSEGYFCPDVVSKCWKEHQSGERNWQHQLWIVLMFQSWLSCHEGCVQ